MRKYTTINYDRSLPQVRMISPLRSPAVVPPAVTWLITGTVAEAGTAMSGISVEFSSLGTSVTDGSGRYSRYVANGYSGTTTPHSASGTFDPLVRVYSSVGANYTGQDFAFYPYPPPAPITIQGTIYLDGTTAPLGTPVLFNGVGTFTQDFVDAQIRYLGTVPYGWTGTTSVLGYAPPAYTVTPGSYAYTSLSSNQTGQNFTITSNYYLISGTITNGGTGFSSALVTNLGTITSAASGSYGYLVAGGYSGTTQPVYITSPGSYAYSGVSADQSGQNFDAPSPLLYFSSLDWTWSLVNPAQWEIQRFDASGSTWAHWEDVSGTLRTAGTWDYASTYRLVGRNSGYQVVTSLSNTVTTPLPPSVSVSGTVGFGGTLFSIELSNGTTAWFSDAVTGSYGFDVPSGWSGTVTTVQYITDPDARVYTNITVSQTGQHYQMTQPELNVAANEFDWSTWAYEVPDRWFIYSRNPVDFTYSVYATNAGTDQNITIGDTGSYYHVTGVNVDSSPATLPTDDVMASSPLPPTINLSGSVFNGTDGSGIETNVYVDGYGTVATDGAGAWNRNVTSPYTGYVAVADNFDGTFNPAAYSYVAQASSLTNQDFALHSYLDYIFLPWDTGGLINEGIFNDVIVNGGGTLVGLDQSGTVYTSINGRTDWTYAGFVSADALRLMYGSAQDMYVSVGFAGEVLRSNGSDLSSWTADASGVGVDLSARLYHNGTYLAGGDGGTMIISTDGTNWTSTSAGNQLIRSICFGGTLYVAVSDYDVTNFNVHTSEDGLTWTNRSSIASTDFLGVAYNANLGLFVAVAFTGAIAVSPNAIDWTDITGAVGGVDMVDVTAGSGSRFVLSTRDGQLYDSTNGTTWSYIMTDPYSYGGKYVGYWYGHKYFIVEDYPPV